MPALLTLGLYALTLLACVVLDVPLLCALLIGLALFFAYGLWTKHPVRELLRAAFAGILTVKNVLLTFLLIGIITALWRCCGTIPFIVYHATAVCSPASMVLLSFLLCCLVSTLMGTSFGTAATAGVICMTMASGMGVPAAPCGGAILAGAFFGDRCSPMSTSAVLVSELTKTDIFSNIRRMVKTAVAPFLLSCAVYLLLGLLSGSAGGASDVRRIFLTHFNLHILSVLPAAAIVVLSLLKLNVRIAMSVSIVLSAAVALFLQKIPPAALLRIALLGYAPEAPELARILSGGGLVSMVQVSAIVCISSCYAGLFRETGLLDGAQTLLRCLSGRLTPFGSMLLASLVTGMIACNQVLSIMLTEQLCREVEPDDSKRALNLENTAVVISPLIPWSIAGAVPLAAVLAPTSSIFFACYLYLLPLWNLLTALWRAAKQRAARR